jgi:hypothetical protein
MTRVKGTVTSPSRPEGGGGSLKANIWLECCGHLRKFTLDRWGGYAIDKARKTDLIFEKDLVLPFYTNLV